MAAYAILLISFPKELSLWGAPLADAGEHLGFLEAFRFSLFHVLPSNLQFDALTSATVLDHIRTEVGLGKSMAQISQEPVFGMLAGVGYEWINLCFLAGGSWLIYKKIITWHIPAALLGAMFVISSLFYFVDPQTFANPGIHLLGGASILGAFFIATDPVTASTTPVGRVVYGAGIGVLTYAIRIWGNYPDGVAFAVLLMGLTVPLLDHYTAPKVYGARKGYDQG
jgi:electron transport complex protein RnfD